jgi:DNA-binding transcriptional regulator YhcF (GntR family)
VFSRFFNGGLDERVRLGESLESFDELGQVSRVLGLNSNTHDRGYRELHGDNGV